MEIAVYVLIGIVFLGLVRLLATRREVERDWRPEELKSGRLVLIEENLITRTPFPVVGRPDRVYRLPDGSHVPVENKNRDNYYVYNTDVAQLSLQAWLMRRNGMKTARHGYVAINNRKTGQRKAVRVDLYDDRRCEQIIARYLDIIHGQVIPTKSKSGKCRFCGHQLLCFHPIINHPMIKEFANHLFRRP